MKRSLVFKAHRLLYNSTLGWRAIKKKKKVGETVGPKTSDAWASSTMSRKPCLRRSEARDARGARSPSMLKSESVITSLRAAARGLRVLG